MNPDVRERLTRKFHIGVSCLIDMLLKIRTSDWTNLPVDFSTGEFGTLQMIEVLRDGATKTEKAAKDLGNSSQNTPVAGISDYNARKGTARKRVAGWQSNFKRNKEIEFWRSNYPIGIKITCNVVVKKGTGLLIGQASVAAQWKCGMTSDDPCPNVDEETKH